MAKNRVSDSGKTRGFCNILVGDNFSVPFVKVTQERGTYFVPQYAQHRPAARAITKGDVYEPQTHEFIDKFMRKKGGSMVHAGTFFGDMLPTFSRYCKGTLYAFEPVLENYVLAKACIQENNLENVFLQNAGLSETTAIARIDTGVGEQKHRGGASQLGEHGQLVGLVAIDNLCADDLVIIQLDVESHELSALKGARASIERCEPVIMIEDNERSCDAFLESLGYSYIRKIPGLFIWAKGADQAIVESILPKKQPIGLCCKV